MRTCATKFPDIFNLRFRSQIQSDPHTSHARSHILSLLFPVRSQPKHAHTTAFFSFFLTYRWCVLTTHAHNTSRTHAADDAVRRCRSLLGAWSPGAAPARAPAPSAPSRTPLSRSSPLCPFLPPALLSVLLPPVHVRATGLSPAVNRFASLTDEEEDAAAAAVIADEVKAEDAHSHGGSGGRRGAARVVGDGRPRRRDVWPRPRSSPTTTRRRGKSGSGIRPAS